jgi:hypothetical protein
VTPAEEAGLVIGELYVVVNHNNAARDGSVLRFQEDDNTIEPYFEIMESNCPDWSRRRNRRGAQCCTRVDRLKPYKEKEMTPTEELEALLKKQEEQTVMIKALQEKIKKEEGYDCVTPVMRLASGGIGILFDDQFQAMLVNCNGRLRVNSTSIDCKYYNEQNLFKWIPCNRSDFKTGDIGYRANNGDKIDDTWRVCAILNDEQYWWINCTGDVRKSASTAYEHWYKLVLKD